jgi:hypothetical protein
MTHTIRQAEDTARMRDDGPAEVGWVLVAGGIDAWRIVGDMGFLEAKLRELGLDEAESDIVRMAVRAPDRGAAGRVAGAATSPRRCRSTGGGPRCSGSRRCGA